eukprot:g2393.t1
MAFQSRHRWVLQKISRTFEIPETTAEHFLSKHFDQLQKFFNPCPPRNKLFVYYQPAEEKSESGDWVQVTDEPVLLFTYGDDVRLNGQACYFVRNILDDKPLRDLEAVVRSVYLPYFEKKKDWGVAEKSVEDDFQTKISDFVGTIHDDIENLVGGIELKKPDRKYEGMDVRNIRTDADTVAHFEELLETWCDEIETYLTESSTADEVSADAGPMTELEWWRQRMQRLTAVTEQIKSKECKVVLTALSSWAKIQQDGNRQKLVELLRRWKHIDINMTEAANEAKDNVKYLFTLEKFLEPLYKGTPSAIIDTLPALMNSIKMIHTIARYYNTTERMTTLFVKITSQMITRCTSHICGNEGVSLWDRDPKDLCESLDICVKLNEAYQEHYRLTKDKLLTMPKGKQFDFNEQQIFGRFDLFCRRAVKLIDMFSTIQQFRALASHRMDGMETLLEDFFAITQCFRDNGHDLLDYNSNKFDRDFVEFNVGIANLERSLQLFINESFESITSISHSLNLLKKFQTILQRESLRADLDDKFTVIFQTYGLELQQVQALYEKHKHNPPIPRNLPPVAGNIMWSRQLLKRIEDPMKKFESNQNVLNTKEAKRIIKTYNKVARTLVAFEYLWYQAWVQSVETAKAGLQATLIIRHPEDKRLYVNFDSEILQLIREAKCLDRMGIEIPESAKIVLLQESKFKSYYSDLVHALREYERIQEKILPVTRKILRPHLEDMEYKLRPGMITLTWTSMNIDAYKHHIHAGLQRLEEVIMNVNDIIENRIEKNLRVVSRCRLVDLPQEDSFSLDEFVAKQERHIKTQSEMLQAKNIEIETAVDDLVRIVTTFVLDPHIRGVDQQDIAAIKSHYNTYMYRAILTCTKESLGAIKKRVGSRGSTGFLFVERPFFDLDVQLSVPTVQLSPNLDEIQRSINKSAIAIIRCSKALLEWNQSAADGDDDDDLDEASKTNDEHVRQRRTFFDRVTKDIEIVRTVLLLTGSVQGTKTQVATYLSKFQTYDWLWRDDKELQYQRFIKKSPSVLDYELELRKFVEVENEIASIAPMHNIGALCLSTRNLKLQLKHECSQWKVLYSEKLLSEARERLDSLLDYINVSIKRLSREVTDLSSLRETMQELKQVREKEAGIEMEIAPILDMYKMLESYLPQGFMNKGEMDSRSVLRLQWNKLVDFAESVQDDLATLQLTFKRKLVKDVQAFYVDVIQFRADFMSNGPMAPNTSPMDAVGLLSRYKEEYLLRERKFELYRSGEELFAMKKTEYPELAKTKNELRLLDRLYGLYVSVIETADTWRELLWQNARSQIDSMEKTVAGFAQKCATMPKKLRDWQAYADLSAKIKSYQTILPLLRALSEKSIKTRHWGQVMDLTGKSFNVDGAELKLATLLDSGLERFEDEIVEIAESASKQLEIELKLNEIKERWGLQQFSFAIWKERSTPVLNSVTPIVEDLEETQMNLQTMLTMQNVAPFKEEAENKLKGLSDTADTLERWIKVQTLWCSLESIFTGGDIARQMPLEAKKFAKVDKMWGKLMSKSAKVMNVVSCCSSDILRNSLPVMFSELEQCQKSLESFLDEKRNIFPRLYFVSNPVLLQILSQGNNAQAIRPFYEKIFDAIADVKHDPKQPSAITTIVGREGDDEEPISLLKPVETKGSGVETWLASLLSEVKRTLKDICGKTAAAAAVHDSVDTLRSTVDELPAQFAVLFLQYVWTEDCGRALEECSSKKNAMKNTAQRANDMLSSISSWTLENVKSNMDRRKIETLITVQMHLRDITNELLDLYRHKQISNCDAFEWQKRTRFKYFAEEKDSAETDGKCTVAITDIEFEYQCEYLGCTDRLVVTPLTDRCFITLAQALGMHMGGLPTGPAGTGKTETVKDFGKMVGVSVVATNCTDQMTFAHCAKILKGTCLSGTWVCFDSLNRITRRVLSVVAESIRSIFNAKKAGPDNEFVFPGDTRGFAIDPMCGIFATMNPEYAGRQVLPENLRALFRSVAMVAPDTEAIVKVKLCASGFERFGILAGKLCSFYDLCAQQLSNQKHYDFGLRNVLSVLRATGPAKRASSKEGEEESEFAILWRLLVRLNRPKLVNDDVDIFFGLLEDHFPDTKTSVSDGRDEDSKLASLVSESTIEKDLFNRRTFVQKALQMNEMLKARHGVMLSGPAGCGKSSVSNVLALALEKRSGMAHKIVRFNPKSLDTAEMYGHIDSRTGEWVQGIFVAMFTKANQSANRFRTWIVIDGPVDPIWVEDLNSTLDDSKTLTIANGDRITMTDNCKLIFENDSLQNASPATVSRVGIVYMSERDVRWTSVATAWIRRQEKVHVDMFASMYQKYFGVNPLNDDADSSVEGHLFDFASKKLVPCMRMSRVTTVSCVNKMMSSLLPDAELSENVETMMLELEKLFIFSMAWSIGGLLGLDDRGKLDEYLRQIDEDMMPERTDGTETVFDYFVDMSAMDWELWELPEAGSQSGGVTMPNVSNILVPTIDSMRSAYLMDRYLSHDVPIMMVGAAGTGKTSTAAMYLRGLNTATTVRKRLNFSRATSSMTIQSLLEFSLDKRGGRKFGPAGGKQMVMFLDDMSLPQIDAWGDQPALECVRTVVESGDICFLEKDKRGDVKTVEGIRWIAAMGTPGAGHNDISDRLKRHFFSFQLTPLTLETIGSIYGKILADHFSTKSLDKETADVVRKLPSATLELCNLVKSKMLPSLSTPHYQFNMRDMSRIFQGVLLLPDFAIKSGSGEYVSDKMKPSGVVWRLWMHECRRVFCDKLSSIDDASAYDAFSTKINEKWFPSFESSSKRATTSAAPEIAQTYFCNFFRDGVEDDETGDLLEPMRSYEPCDSLERVRDRVCDLLKQHNDAYPMQAMHPILFDYALEHLLRIVRIVSMPRGSALLVGMEGSGKRTLARLASAIAGHEIFTVTQSCDAQTMRDDLRNLYQITGHQRKPITWIVEDTDIDDASCLECVNSLLTTGEVADLFSLDQILAMCADLEQHFEEERPNQLATRENMIRFFYDNVRDNLHVVLAFSPLRSTFTDWAHAFPGIYKCTTIDWFLDWPVEALTAVARHIVEADNAGSANNGATKDGDEDANASSSSSIVEHLAAVHRGSVSLCKTFSESSSLNALRFPPRTYISFVQKYKELHDAKMRQIVDLERKTSVALAKLTRAEEDVTSMRDKLTSQREKLEQATKATNSILTTLQESSLQAKKDGDVVVKLKEVCAKERAHIASEKKVCDIDLAKAMPFARRASEAVASISPSRIPDLKRDAKKGKGGVGLVLDCVGILFMRPLELVKQTEHSVGSETFKFLQASNSSTLTGNAAFLKDLAAFSASKKDEINDETMELLEPYINLGVFDPDTIESESSDSAAKLCSWVRSLFAYNESSQFVRPKLESLASSEAALEAASEKLKIATSRFNESKSARDELQTKFEAQMAHKQQLADNSAKITRRMEQASELVRDLAEERKLWESNTTSFAVRKKHLVGDCAAMSAFLSYAGFFDDTHRDRLLEKIVVFDGNQRGISHSEDLNISKFLANESIVNAWFSCGLPSSCPRSLQNALLTTRAPRYPLLIDPHGQGLEWLLTHERENLPRWGTSSVKDGAKKNIDRLETCLGEGKTMIVVDLEDNVSDFVFENVLEKRILTKARGAKCVKVGDRMCEYKDSFRLYFVTRSANPSISPVLMGRTTLIDFRVTQEGLEEQLLSRVLEFEQSALEAQLKHVTEQTTLCTAALAKLDDMILNHLSEDESNHLLDDPKLVEILARHKEKALEVKQKLDASSRMRAKIAEKREQYRPVARRGASLYFAMTEMRSMNPMYQTSLPQFHEIF